MTLIEIIKYTYVLLSPQRRRQLLWVFVGICVTGLAELAFAASVSLLGIALAAPDSPQKISPLWKLFQMVPSFGDDLPQNIKMLILVLVLVCTAACVKNIISAIMLYWQNSVAQTIGWDMGTVLFEKYLQAPYVWLTQHNPSTLGTYLGWRLSVGFYVLGVLQTLSQSLILLILMAGSLFVAPQISMLLFGTAGLIAALIYKMTRHHAHEMGKRIALLGVEVGKVTHAALLGMREVQIYSQGKAFLRNFSVYAAPSSRAYALQAVFPMHLCGCWK